MLNISICKRDLGFRDQDFVTRYAEQVKRRKHYTYTIQIPLILYCSLITGLASLPPSSQIQLTPYDIIALDVVAALRQALDIFIDYSKKQ